MSDFSVDWMLALSTLIATETRVQHYLGQRPQSAQRVCFPGSVCSSYCPSASRPGKMAAVGGWSITLRLAKCLLRCLSAPTRPRERRLRIALPVPTAGRPHAWVLVGDNSLSKLRARSALRQNVFFSALSNATAAFSQVTSADSISAISAAF